MDIRQTPPDEFEAWYRACERAFATDPTPEAMAREQSLFEPERSLSAVDGAVVGTAAVYSLDMAVPGAVTPAAGVTGVSVATTHRRQGLLTRLMERQLDGIRESGRESFAALWASEPSIYGRFGYGLAAWNAGVTVPTRYAAFSRPVPSGWVVREVDPATLPKTVAETYAEWHRGRPGSFARDERWWTRRLEDPPERRDGASSLRGAVVESGETIAGYALYAVKPTWGETGPEGVLTVREIVATDPAAAAVLWRFLLDHDLVATVGCWSLPTDSALLHLLRDVRRAGVRVKDQLWVRLVDPARALTERHWTGDGTLVLEVVDEFRPWGSGRWRLDATRDGAQVRPTTESADLTLGVADLGAAYLGSTSMTALAAAGRLDEHTSGAVARADTLFRWPVAAWCQEVF